MALRALLLSTEKGAADVRGTVEIIAERQAGREPRADRRRTTTCCTSSSSRTSTRTAPTRSTLRFDGKGGLAYQVVGRYFLPWNEKPAAEALSIDVAYDRTRLAQDDIATATATVKNNLSKTANMVMVDLGIPPGFDLLSEDLQDYQEKSATESGRLEKFSLTATQAILYFDSIAPGDTVDAELPPARQVSDPRADLPVARLRILRSGGEFSGAAGGLGSSQPLTACGRVVHFEIA